MKFKSLALVLSLASSPFIIAQDYLYRTPLDGVKASSGTNQPAEPATPEIGDIYEGGYYAGAVGANGEDVIVGSMTSATLDWYDAMDFCNNSVEAGYDDWVLPKRTLVTRTIQSVNDYAPEYSSVQFWTSTSIGSDYADARRIDENDVLVARSDRWKVIASNTHAYCVRML